MFLLVSIFDCTQHIDSPDNNPDLPWEFNDTNKEKVSIAYYPPELPKSSTSFLYDL